MGGHELVPAIEILKSVRENQALQKTVEKD
jgi:hypothetical protein